MPYCIHARSGALEAFNFNSSSATATAAPPPPIAGLRLLIYVSGRTLLHDLVRDEMPSGPPGPSTPMRAITSTLAARSAPRIPPATQTYEPLVKSIIGKRLVYSILAPSLAYSWALANVWSKWSQGGPSQLGLWGSFVDCVKPLTLLYASAIWVLGVVPALVIRNRFLTGESRLHRALWPSPILGSCKPLVAEAVR